MFHTLKPPLGARIIPGHPMANGLVGCWVMNERGGNKAFDLSGNGNNLVITSGASWCPDGLDFSGAVQVENTNCKNLPLTKGSIFIKINNDDWANAHCFIELSDDSTSDRIVFYTGPSKLYLYVVGSGSGNNVYIYNNPENILSNGVTYDLVVTFDTIADNYKVYINSIELSPNETNYAGNPTTINTVNLGTYYNLTTDYDGRILNCCIYNKILIPPEIASLRADPYIMFRHEPIYLWHTEGAAGGLSIQAANNSSSTEITGATALTKIAQLTATDVSSSPELTGTLNKIAYLDCENVSSNSELTATLNKIASLTGENVSSSSELTADLNKIAALSPTDVSSSSEITAAIIDLSYIILSAENVTSSSELGGALNKIAAISAEDITSETQLTSALNKIASIIATDVSSSSEITAASLIRMASLVAESVSSSSGIDAPTMLAIRQLSATDVSSLSALDNAALSAIKQLIAGDVESLPYIGVPSFYLGGVTRPLINFLANIRIHNFNAKEKTFNFNAKEKTFNFNAKNRG